MGHDTIRTYTAHTIGYLVVDLSLYAEGGILVFHNHSHLIAVERQTYRDGFEFNAASDQQHRWPRQHQETHQGWTRNDREVSIELYRG